MTTYITYGNITSINMSNGTLYPLLNFANDVTNGMFGVILLAAIWLVSFMTFSNQPYKDKAMVASLYTTLLASFLMFGAGLLHPFYFISTMLLLGFGLYISSRWHSGG